MTALIRSHILGLTITFFVLLIAGLTYYSVAQYRALTATERSYRETVLTLESTKLELAQKEADLAQYGTNLDELRQSLALSEESASELSRLLQEEKERNNAFQDQIGDMGKTVGKLDKLSQLDKELLMKYSKVYFLNEHYAPEKVALIASSSLARPSEPEYINARVLPFLEDMLEEAGEDGVSLKILSGYRSYDEQKSLKSTYTVTYGSGANTFSADQGYSEHQLGATVDITTEALGGGLTGFENTDAYAWLGEHAHKYGFVLSYPEKNGYYIFEPWHWRFVGEKLARHLHREGLYFYDMDQREIDTYLISIFD